MIGPIATAPPNEAMQRTRWRGPLIYGVRPMGRTQCGAALPPRPVRGVAYAFTARKVLVQYVIHGAEFVGRRGMGTGTPTQRKAVTLCSGNPPAFLIYPYPRRAGIPPIGTRHQRPGTTRG
jgi:hypothetical protein